MTDSFCGAVQCTVRVVFGSNTITQHNTRTLICSGPRVKSPAENGARGTPPARINNNNTRSRATTGPEIKKRARHNGGFRGGPAARAQIYYCIYLFAYYFTQYNIIMCMPSNILYYNAHTAYVISDM